MVKTHHKMNEGRDNVMKVLRKRYGEHTDRFCQLLKSTGSLIAGGSILACILNDNIDRVNDYTDIIKVNDIDVYVPIKNSKEFLHELLYKEGRITPDIPDSANPGKAKYTLKSFSSSLYCSSFLKRNGIKRVITLNTYPIKPPPVRRGEYIKHWESIDIMLVRNKTTPLEVVTNFDLTFCECWFDGQDVWASFPEDIRNKDGKVQSDYVDMVIRKNNFTMNRINKYIAKGFKISLEAKTDLNNVLVKGNPCLKGESPFKYEKNYNNWVVRLLLEWLSGHRTKVSRLLDADDNPVLLNLADILVVPQVNRIDIEDHENKFDHTSLKPDPYDGYDTDDYIEENNINLEKLVSVAPSEIAYYKAANKLYEITSYPFIFEGYAYGSNLALIYGMNYPDSPQAVGIKTLMDKLKSVSLRSGTGYLLEDEGTLYDLHDHPKEAGITSDGLEAYLTGHIRDVDKNAVPCYYKPNTDAEERALPEGEKKNCHKHITLPEVRYSTSEEFYKMYSTNKTVVKTGLIEMIPLYDATLFNTKGEDRTYGMIYHHTVCPFCLQFESRSEGCSYMTHDNPKGLAIKESPYCQKDFLVKEIRDKYMDIALRYYGPAAHFEFCAECGRPCINHMHITSTPPYTLIENGVDARGHIDYGSCTGGGRPELFARILAIRKVYREGTNADEENDESQAIFNNNDRIQAALAANEAPNDPELMAQGKAIFEQITDERKWPNSIPKKRRIGIALGGRFRQTKKHGVRQKKSRKTK